MKLEKKQLGALAICLALGIVGVVAWMHEGLGSLSDVNNMGVYIILFFFLESVCAGSLFAAAFFNVRSQGSLALVGLAAGIGAGLAIFADLGTLGQAWRLFAAMNLTSPLLLDVVFLALCIGLAAILLFSERRGSVAIAKASRHVLKVVSVALPLGTAWFCLTLDGRPGWGSSLVVAEFVAQAILVGLLIAHLFERESESISRAARVVAVANAILVIGMMGIALYDSGEEALYLREMIAGSGAPVFLAYFVGGVCVPAALMVAKRATAFASALGIVGVLVAKVLLLMRALFFPYSAYGEGVMVPLAWKFDGGVAYVPSVWEVVAAIGIVALCLAIVCLLWSAVAKGKGAAN